MKIKLHKRYNNNTNDNYSKNCFAFNLYSSIFVV